MNENPSVLRTYRDAVRSAKHTNRTTNSLWYRKPCELPAQWHISIDGDTVTSKVWIAKENSWNEGPEIRLEQLKSPPENLADTMVKKILKGNRGKDKRALGIILHLHNSFQLSEIRSEFSETGEDFSVLDEFIRIAPGNILSGRQVDTNTFSYALLPYWGMTIGRNSVALQTPNSFIPFVKQFTHWGEDHNTPVKVTVTAAPLEALAQYAPTREETPESDTPRDGRIIIFRSRATSFIAVLNRKDELASARIVVNQQGDGLPANLNQLLHTCAAAENIENPAIGLFNLAGTQTPLLTATLELENIDLIENLSTTSIPIEFANRKNSPDHFPVSPVSENQTFNELREGWANQNLYTLACQDPDRFPSQGNLRILKLSRITRTLLALAVPAAIGWCAMKTIQNSNEEYWKIKKSDVIASSNKVEQLDQEKKQITYWENLMVSRSEGWIPLTAVLDFFPEDKGILLTHFNYRFYALPTAKKSKHLPLRQTWRAKGHATDAGMQHLVSMSSKSILTSKFEKIGEWSESPVYLKSEDTRELKVVLDQKHESMTDNDIISKAVARHFRKGFEVEIDRDFSAKDDIAMVIKAPSSNQPEEIK